MVSSRSHTRRGRLVLEQLESRLLLSGVEPTPTEQLFLEQLNDARSNPAAYGAAVGVDLSAVAPSQPLAFDTRLIAAARLHSQDMNARDYFAHTTPDGVTPGQRLTAADFPWTSWGESIAGGQPTTASALSALIIDAGVPDLGHRLHLLAVTPNFQPLHQVGIGIVQGGAGTYHDYYTIDSSVTADKRPFLTGSVFRDANGNGKYDVGEGLGGVTLTIAKVGAVATWGSGGYGWQLGAGTYTVTASGGGLASPLTRTVTVGTQNVRLNFIVAGSATGGGGVPVSGGGAAGGVAATAGSQGLFVTGVDAGGGPNVKVFDAATGQVIFNFLAYDVTFTGGVRVAAGDVNGDGVADVITAPGPGGGPDIKVFDGKTGGLIRQFFAFAPTFAGGLYLAAGDVNGDGFADVVTGADAGGGPNVAVFDGRTIASGSPIVPLMNLFPYAPTFTGGVRVAAGDVNGDGRADLITGAGPGGGPNVTVINGATGTLLASFFPYAPGFTAGVYVAAGDVNGDGRDDLITGAGAGGGPNVALFSGADFSPLLSFFPYDAHFTGGVRVGVADRNGDGRADIICVAGPGGGPDVRSVNGLTGTQLDDFFAYDPQFAAGLFVAGSGR